MTPERREQLRDRVRRLNNEATITLFPLPDIPRDSHFSDEHRKAFTRIGGTLGEALAIAYECLEMPQ